MLQAKPQTQQIYKQRQIDKALKSFCSLCTIVAIAINRILSFTELEGIGWGWHSWLCVLLCLCARMCVYTRVCAQLYTTVNYVCVCVCMF